MAPTSSGVSSSTLFTNYRASLTPYSLGPETVDRALIGASCRRNDGAQTLEFTRIPSNGGRQIQSDEKEARESVIYRIHPARESSRLIFQIGTASPDLAVQAAHVVAPHVAGIDVNAGCPKPFSTSGGMGAALLTAPDLLCSILSRLINEVGAKYEIGISVKIRLLSREEETEALVKRLCKTGITGLTVHCRTRAMRKHERAIRDQLRMVGEICRAAGVACLMNGDVEGREEAERLVREYGVDGAMIATAAEKNPSVFRAEGPVGWREVAHGYVEEAMAVENRWGNTKFLLTQMVPGKEQGRREFGQAKNYEDVCRKLEFDGLVERAREVDGILGLSWRGMQEVPNTRSKPRAEGTHAQAKKQKPNSEGQDADRRRESGRTDFLMDLHHDIVAPAVKV